MFGTVEYFVSEMRHLAENTDAKKDEFLSDIYSKFQKELKHDFVCDEKIRVECLQNLSVAYQNVVDNADSSTKLNDAC
ncbi:hypothetical protein [Bacillus sp. V5-8f]|uniref:hypothetical protein n=1 Tax=Bacillus sp. V5-8f TaxID=2053044 RepID=UPI000C761171|nr:hypothetical protein [Bacillus sp. V5-8f]PLT35790.1 hypothetical protein CUU64_00505 [Bacillus sp. V5-8f]